MGITRSNVAPAVATAAPPFLFAADAAEYFTIPAASKPTQHDFANFATGSVEQLLVVNSNPLVFTSGAANATSSAMSFLTLQRFFLEPMEVDGGSRITISYCSLRFERRLSQSKPFCETGSVVATRRKQTLGYVEGRNYRTLLEKRGGENKTKQLGTIFTS